MNKMEALYEKVSKDSKLQAEFTEIMKNAETAGKTEAEQELLSFAKNAGFEISLEEMRDFFEGKSGELNGQLSDAELDMVAGGKTTQGLICGIITSGVTLGIGCALISAGCGKSLKTASCEEFFENMTQQEL